MVGYERLGAAAVVTIDRPERRNAIAAFPKATMLSDREAAHAAQGLPPAEDLRLEARLGRERLRTALEGAQRFRVRP